MESLLRQIDNTKNLAQCGVIRADFAAERIAFLIREARLHLERCYVLETTEGKRK